MLTAHFTNILLLFQHGSSCINAVIFYVLTCSYIYYSITMYIR